MRCHLVLLSLVALVPMLAWAAVLTVWNAAQERHAIERGLEETAEALTLAVDQSIRLTSDALATLALSSAVTAVDHAVFLDQAQRLVDRHPEWLGVVLADPSGRQIANTAQPPSEAASQAIGAAIRQTAATGRPVVSNLLPGGPHGQMAVAVAVPATDPSGRVSHVLMASVSPDGLAALLRSGTVPPGWLAGLLDRDMTIVARNMDHRRLVGRTAPAWFRQAAAEPSRGVVDGLSIDGRQFTFAFNRSAMTGWTIAFGAPREVFLAHLRRTFMLTAGFGLLMLGVSLALALWISGRILHPVRALTTVAAPFVPANRPAAGVYDVTELDELHRALEGLTVALSASEARFRAVFSVAPVMLFVLDDEARFVEVNDTWLRTLGYGRGVVLGRHPWDFQTPESRTHTTEIVRAEFLRTGRIDDTPANYVTREGEIRDVLVSLRAERDGAGRICRTIGAMRDVTDQRRIEKALNGAVEEAAKANAAKVRFLAAASHDLRQPLQALSLYLGVLNTRLGDAEKTVRAAIGQCVDSLSALLNDMLDVARLDAGTIVPKVEEVPVSRLMERVAANWGIQAEAKGLRLSVLPSRKVVRTDPALMERVLSNLVANAVRYTDRGRILVGCRRAAGGGVRLEVWDTGIGIPADKLATIFEEFRQLGNPEQRRDKGTGLGLAIVQRIAGLLGHPVSVRSVVGKGSVFTVTLPAAAAAAAGTAAAAERPLAASGGRARRILVIEDEVHVRGALELVLAGLGHEVAAGASVDGALARLGACRPELVIADYRLGDGTTGVEAIRRVRARFGDDVPAVVLTGDTDTAVIRRIAGEGLPLLHKPLQVEALRTFLGEVA